MKIQAKAHREVERLVGAVPSEGVSAPLDRLSRGHTEDASLHLDGLRQEVDRQLAETDLRAEVEWMTQVTLAIAADDALGDSLQPQADRLLDRLKSAQQLPTTAAVSRLREPYDMLEQRYYKELEAREQLRQWATAFRSLGVSVVATANTLTILPGQAAELPDSLAYRFTSVGNGGVDGEPMQVEYLDPTAGTRSGSIPSQDQLQRLCDYVHRHTGVAGEPPSATRLATYEVRRHTTAARKPAQMMREFDR